MVSIAIFSSLPVFGKIFWATGCIVICPIYCDLNVVKNIIDICFIDILFLRQTDSCKSRHRNLLIGTVLPELDSANTGMDQYHNSLYSLVEKKRYRYQTTHAYLSFLGLAWVLDQVTCERDGTSADLLHNCVYICLMSRLQGISQISEYILLMKLRSNRRKFKKIENTEIRYMNVVVLLSSAHIC